MGKKHLIILTSLVVSGVMFAIIPYIIRPDRSVSPALETGTGPPVVRNTEPPIMWIPQESQAIVDEEILPRIVETTKERPVIEEEGETREQRIRRIRNSPEYRRLAEQFREVHNQRNKFIDLVVQLDDENVAEIKRINSEFSAARYEFKKAWVAEQLRKHGESFLTPEGEIPSLPEDIVPEEISSSTRRRILQEMLEEHQANEALLKEEIAQMAVEMKFLGAQMREMLGE